MVLAVAGYLLRPGTPADPVYRQIDATGIRSLIDERTPLARDRCVLRWSAGPEGTTYRLRISRDDLTLVTVADRLERAEYLVPAAILAPLPPGARLLWQVDAVMPDGSRASSATFFATLP
jgi:hypothetical protein